MTLPTFWPHPDLRAYWESGAHQEEGATQPCIQALLYHLILATNAKHVVELGTWKGATSRWLACAIAANGGGTLTLVDKHKPSLDMATERVQALRLGDVTITPVCNASLDYVQQRPIPTRDFVFLDDDKADVVLKIQHLREGGMHGIIAIHDIETVAAESTPGVIRLTIPVEPSGGHLGLITL